jgi:hypothetical protein
MLQCYVLTCGRSATAFSAPPRSQRPGQGPRSPDLKAGAASRITVAIALGFISVGTSAGGAVPTIELVPLLCISSVTDTHLTLTHILDDTIL